MLPVAELLSVGREPLERSIWANLAGERKKKNNSATKPLILTSTVNKLDVGVHKDLDTA